MNCQSFANHAVDLARGEAMDAALRIETMAHARECVRCAAVLADQQSLSNGLRALREAGCGASTRESAVMAAFRAHHALPARRPRIWRWPAGAAAAAAVAFLVWRGISPLPVQSPVSESAPKVDPRPLEEPAAVAPRLALAQAAAPVAKPSRRRRVPPANTPPKAPAEVPAVETATEFLPIPYTPAWNAEDGGQIIRVRLPRSSMRSFGLPVSEDRFYEKVQADVLLGGDGIARAVRFVSNR